MKMDVISAGRLKMRKSIYMPAENKDDMVELPVVSVLLRHPSGNVLFDTGCAPEAGEDPIARWGGLARVMQPIFGLGDTVVAQLPRFGLGADDIDVVICSHLHPDHCGCNAAFARATVIAHRAELAAARAEDGPRQGYLPQEWDIPQGYEEIEGEKDLFGDNRIVLVPMPGHSPGLTAARVELNRDGTFLLASDAAPMMCHVDETRAPKNSWDIGLATNALAEIRAEKDRGTTVICGHDDAQWQELRARKEGFR
ncbi:MBL fold metallo-hydrolase [Frigidibacter albus]|uniref:MBL fold metallo-hydrolase n=1 Tax=Frigidibacter albus TaxID=1465486 RepID=A0A6L8VLA1_9RHOB|nr:N-acyl homoserine lactonase family protein [Frigidibacter albus]MZQ91138.1 MBL fold metallo-hydrolase [Frigidibacter albus]NBE33051.1 MBL fold metallo-hydrolase [Frigidibacter albus]GGH62982.1 MBL fold metallo-hydrolase [Frigidibacter albus]